MDNENENESDVMDIIENLTEENKKIMTSQKLWNQNKHPRNMMYLYWKDGENLFQHINIIHMNWVLSFEEKYKFIKKIGSGRYGKVYKAIEKETNKLVATKIVERQDEYLRELNHLIALENAYGVCQLQKVCFIDNKMLMQFELGECSLAHYVQLMDPMEPLKFTDLILKWFEEILKSIVDIHKHRILHRDLKPDNIIMIQNSEGELLPQMIDFGLSKKIVGDISMSDTIWYDIYTYCYRPPELWQQKKNQDIENNIYRKYSIKAESWALGILFLEMLTKTILFRTETLEQANKMICDYVKNYLGHNPFRKNFGIPEISPKIKKEKKSFKNIEDKIEDYLMRKWNIEGIIELHIWKQFKFLHPDHKLKKSEYKAFGKGDIIISRLFAAKQQELFIRNFRLIRMLIYGLLHPLPEKRWFPIDCLRVIQYLKIINEDYLKTPMSISPSPTLHNNIHKKRSSSKKNSKFKISLSMEFKNTKENIRTDLNDLLEGRVSPNQDNLIKTIDTSYNMPNILELNCLEQMKEKKINLIHYKLFYDYPFHRIFPRNDIIVEEKEIILNLLMCIFNFANEKKPEPKPFFQSIYLWLSFLFGENTKWRTILLEKDEHPNDSRVNVKNIITIYFGCLALIDEYCYSDNSFLRYVIKRDSPFREFYNEKRLIFIKDFIISQQQGRIWIHNPGELRYLFFDLIESMMIWDTNIDGQICKLILKYLHQKFEIPHPDLIIENILFN